MRTLSLAVLILCFAATAHAVDSYDPASKRLTIPSIVIGDATYTNMVVTIGGVVSGPSGTSANAAVDSYNPAAKQITVSSVTLAGRTYYNVVATVAGLVSVGGVSGADTYDGAHLSVPAVQVQGGPLYNGVVVSVASIVSSGGGMPGSAFDTYDPVSRRLTIAAIQLGNTVYTNPVVVPGTVLSVAGPAGHFAYVANGGSGTISTYAIDSSTGALSEIAGSPFPIQGIGQPWEIKVDPSGRFVYVLDFAASGVFGYAINRSNGSLTVVNGGVPFPAGNAPQSITFDATGAYAYVANLTDNTLSDYAVDPLSGALSALAGSPYPIAGTVATPEQVVSAGNFLYVADYQTSSVDVFAIDPATGALKEGVPGSPFPTDTGPYSLAVDPSGSVLYTANAGSGGGSVSAFTINKANGALQAVAGNPLPIPAYEYVSIDPQGRFLFVAEASAIGVYPIDTTTGVVGAQVSGSPFAAGTHPNIAVVDPTGRFVYAGNDGSSDVSEYTFDAGTGALAPIAGSPVPAGSLPDFIAID